MFRFLVVQTAFTGDVVLATSIIEKLNQYFAGARIDFLLRKGNEGLLQGHPYISELIIWDKQRKKYRNLLRIAARVRRNKYTHVINLHRYAASGFVTMRSGAGYRSGFDKNPFSFCYTRKVHHRISATDTVHEIARNQQLIADITDENAAMPALYPSQADKDRVQPYTIGDYICIAPSSVWFTKRLPENQWSDLISALPASHVIYILGAASDSDLAERIRSNTKHPMVFNLCGALSFLQSAALMRSAKMNYTNDSAPLHMAAAMNAPVTAVYTSTVPAYGFGPVRPNGHIVETAMQLSCRPCGLHGHQSCPEGHFKCAKTITNQQLLWWT